ncbi:G kinase-anchoring protein 1-like isoform X1 [Biomphalaria glabrata]|uniref:G kinase-anchoring protein 1-like isoform X1 n=1 Tax=Biomphalaria glabrata TaxID=6526 RepID=A0A9W2YMD1_BIOGL|nr:G kinase-anchoring protein 1-like isoform X1 [Biomphalaria glabrata]KAI8768995.1 G kinase-anchoring protein 1-like [Biomphalaria glabrata]
MANRQAIAVSTSRFAVLKIEDDDEEDKKPTKNSAQQQNSTVSSSNKKKTKKKKDTKESEQLKNLAFGKGGGKQSQHKSGAGDGEERKLWDQWREHDKELVEEQFKDDLAAALLQSRLDAEKQNQEKQKQKERIEAGIEVPNTREGRKKKKQREKPQAMSLEQFKQLPPEKPVNSDSEAEDLNSKSSTPPVQTRVPPTQQDPTFFNSIEDDAEQILQHEKIQEQYKKQFASDSVIVAKLKNDLEKKDKQLVELKKQIESMEEELKQVKKRNKQFCVILGQGEMKDKAQVLLQVDELTLVKDELTEQVSTLTAELEKEKSKNHALKAELDKVKPTKHGK